MEPADDAWGDNELVAAGSGAETLASAAPSAARPDADPLNAARPKAVQHTLMFGG